MSMTGPLSELEYLILAMVGDGTSSGYAMRKEMNRMRGGRWSSESGSVYRVLRRLQDANLVSEERRAGATNRERTEYVLTSQGTATLNAWLVFAPDRSEMVFLTDPIRTRAYFLGRLKRSDQIRVVKMWLIESKKLLAELERELSATAFGEPVRDLAYWNIYYLAEARHEWLRKLLALIRTNHSAKSEPLDPTDDPLAE
jgi:DNA-binding PadR family transcriptional regulator